MKTSVRALTSLGRACAMLLALTYGARASDVQPKVGLSIGTLKQERWQREIAMFQTFARANGLELLVRSAEDDAQRQVAQCEELISQGVRVLIVQALDSEVAGDVVEPAHQAGIPVVAYDRLVRNGALDYYVTFDSEKVGELEARQVVSKAPKGNYIWLGGGLEDFNAQLVHRGQKKVLQPLVDRGEIKVVLERWCAGWDPEEARRHTEEGIAAAHGDIRGIVAPNDGTAAGAIRALTAHGLAGRVAVSGQDAELAACRRVIEGTQTGTVYKPLAKLNLATSQLALALVRRGKPTRAVDKSLGRWGSINNGTKDVATFFVDVVAVDRSNMKSVVAKEGFHSMEEIFGSAEKKAESR